MSIPGEAVQISRMGGPWEPLEDFGNCAFEMVAIPEPRSAVLLATGVAALFLYSWRFTTKPRRNAPNKVTGANSRPASQFESRGLRRRALVVGSHGRYHGGAAVAQFGR